MKYFIPTSTSNFNCLLADESISPCGFYEKRGFSYNYFTAIPLNDNKVLLPLFRSCPEFELSDDVPGFPLILEIDINLNENEFRQKSREDGIILYIGKTLYFNPFNVRFIFRNQKEMNETMTATHKSIETKLVAWYKKRFTTIGSLDANVISSFSGSDKCITDSHEEIEQDFLESDARRDRLKGALWGYTIGANLSREDKSYAELRKLLEKMRDSLSTQIGETKSTDKDSMANLRNDINGNLEKAQEPTIEKYCMRWDEQSAAYNVMFASCASPGIKSTAIKEAGVYQLGQFAGNTSADVNSYIDEAIKKIAKEVYPPKPIAIDNIPSVDKKHLTIIRSNENRQAVFILNLTLAKYARLFTEDKPSYVRKIAEELKRKYPEQQWQEFEPFLKMLHDSWNGIAPLKLDEAPDDIMKSFALFCKKGSMDSLEDLECVLLSNGILDLSFAYALWGAVYGYSAMPKTVIDATLSDYPKKYAEEAMRRIYEEISDKPHFETKTDPWREQKELIIGAWPDLYEIRDTEDSRTASRPKKNWPIEKILKKCNSIDDWKNQVDKTWKKKSDIYQAHIEFINGQRKFNDTQR